MYNGHHITPGHHSGCPSERLEGGISNDHFVGWENYVPPEKDLGGWRSTGWDRQGAEIQVVSAASQRYTTMSI